MIKKCIFLSLLLIFTLGQSAFAQNEVECQFDVIVQVDDWLSKLSEKFYGDVLAYPAIFDATNAKAAIDDTYAVIEDEDLIEPGWKLCIVGVAPAEEILGFELENAPAVDNTPTNLNGPILVGAAHALSGPLAAQGELIQNGINLAVAEVNQSQYLGDGILEVIWEDTAGSETQAAAAFERLVGQTELVAILGPTLSRSAFAANPIAQEASVPVIGSSNTEAGITEIGSYVFRTSMAESAVIAGTVEQATNLLSLQNVVIVYDNANAFTRNSLPIFEQALAAENVEVQAVMPFETGNPDFSGQLAELSALNTDAIFLVALSEDAAKIITQAREFGVSETISFIGGHSINATPFFETGRQAVNGTLAGSVWNLSNNTGSNRQFVAAYQAAYNDTPDQLAAQAYTAVWVLATALRESDSTDRSVIRDALAGLEFVDSPLGLFSFDDSRNPGHPLVLQVAQDGEFVTNPQPTDTP
jgi:branched-chain amino acid transport system substrate-binding protein